MLPMAEKAVLSEPVFEFAILQGKTGISLEGPPPMPWSRIK
jgi:hypothetical protein